MVSFLERQNNFFIKKLALIVLFFAFIFSPLVTLAATLGISPSSGTYSVGQTFTVTFSTSSPSQSINAVSGSFNYSRENLEIVSVSKSGSIFSLWVQEPNYANASGTGSFEGVILNPGYIGSNGKLVSYTFRVKAPGTGTIRMGSTSILANDGNGTNIFTGSGSATFTLTETPQRPIPIVEPVIPKEPIAPTETPLAGILEIREIPRISNTDPGVQFRISVKNSKQVFKKYEIRIDQRESFIWEDVDGQGIFTAPRLAPGNHTILVKTLEHNAEITGYADFSITGLPQPEIMQFTRINHIAQQPVVVYGTGEIDTQVKITFAQGGIIAHTETILVDQQGRFLFIIDDKLAPGVYSMSVTTQGESGATSTPTDALQIKVKRHPFIDVGFTTMSVPMIMMLAGAVTIGSIVCAWVFYTKYQRTKIKTRRRKITTFVKDSLLE